MCALEDVEVQRKGIVLVLYDFAYDRQEEAAFMVGGLKLRQSFPWRLAGIHYISTNRNSNAAVTAFIGLVHFAIGRDGRLRFRMHQGEYQPKFE